MHKLTNLNFKKSNLQVFILLVLYYIISNAFKLFR